MANAVSEASGLGKKRVEELTEHEMKKVEDMLANPGNYGIPAWIFNRRSDPAAGTDRHIVSADLELTHKMDINELKKRKCYRGIRHIQGLPVRGQRTRSSFRKAATVGVSRSKAIRTAKAAESKK
jgi:small subunit ribosomal protein S13